MDPDSQTHSLQHSGGSTLEIEGYILRVIDGVDKGSEFTAASARCVVGKHQASQMVLSDKSVSRFHFELRIGDGGLVIRDLKSRNGTMLNGVSIIEAVVAPGAVIEAGRTRIRVEKSPTPIRLPLAKPGGGGRITAHSVAMRQTVAVLEQFAKSEAPVLIRGETGVGKELAAEVLHELSPRKDGAFVFVDCASISRNLLASELFGHEAGAFTGATEARPGVLELANGGTLVIDGISELDIDLQPLLLRAIDRRQVQRIGGNRWMSVDVRFICTIQKNLRIEVNEHRFRSDLYYRLAVLEVVIPPLRERLEDIPALVDAILEDIGYDSHAFVFQLKEKASLARLASQSWPGNVRQLRNYLERAMTAGVAGASLAEPSATNSTVDACQPLAIARDQWQRQFEQEYLFKLLRAHDDNVSAAAKTAGVNRTTLHRLLRKAGLR